MSGFFVTGTDTGVGKTLVSAALLAGLAQRGVACLGMKPVSAGASLAEGVWHNEDAEALQAAASVWAPLELINPIALPEPIAPHIAASHARQTIVLAPLLAAYSKLRERADMVIVEGVGGFCVPLASDLDTTDLAVALDLPVILVVGLRLGCLNHALLTCEAVHARGLKLAGWIASHIDPAMRAADENITSLENWIKAPRLGTIPHLQGRTDSRLVATHLHFEAIMTNLQRLPSP